MAQGSAESGICCTEGQDPGGNFNRDAVHFWVPQQPLVGPWHRKGFLGSLIGIAVHFWVLQQPLVGLWHRKGFQGSLMGIAVDFWVANSPWLVPGTGRDFWDLW